MKIEDILPTPIVELLTELLASDDPADAAFLAEYLRKMSLEAYSIAYGRSRARIAAALPPAALDEYAEEPEVFVSIDILERYGDRRDDVRHRMLRGNDIAVYIEDNGVTIDELVAKTGFSQSKVQSMLDGAVTWTDETLDPQYDKIENAAVDIIANRS